MIRNDFRLIQSNYYKLRKAKKYQEALETLQSMVALLEANKHLFDEPEDRIRLCKAQMVMTGYEEGRLTQSAKQNAALLRKAADWSTPSVCLSEPCANLAPQVCVARKAAGLLSQRQAKMCVERISFVSDALKLEAADAMESREGPDYQAVLARRREAASLHKWVLKLDASTKRAEQQRYLDYSCSVTEGQVSLHAGDFDLAKQWFEKALELAKKLPLQACFPNFFINIKEIQAHEIYISGVDCVRKGKFGEGRALFEKWLNLFPELATNNLRYDNIRVFSVACRILHELGEEGRLLESPDTKLSFLKDIDVSLPTWVLIKRLRGLLSRTPSREALTLGEEIRWFAEHWRLFVPDSALLAEDKTAGYQRRVNLPSFMNMFDRLEMDEFGQWKELLAQNVKNLFLVMADYESKRHSTPPPEEEELPRLPRPVLPSEAMSTNQLAEIVVEYLKRRSQKHAGVFREALQHVRPFEEAINRNNFEAAMTAEKAMFEAIRFWPHTIQVKGQEPVSIYSASEQNHVFRARKTHARRLWDRYPRTIIFEGPQDLEVGKFYYLRPSWNIKPMEQFTSLNEQFHRSDVPRWCNVLFENIFGTGKVDPGRFRSWVLQFKPSERLRACRIFDMLTFYNDDEVRRMWTELLRNKLPPEAKTRNVLYAGLGHTGKSGAHTLYYLKQAMSKLGEGELSLREGEAFRHLSVAGQERDKPHTVIFVDDLISTGKQATKFLKSNFEEHEWLKAADVFYCALVGFGDGIEKVRENLEGKIRDVLVSERLGEKDRAFSESNPSWESSAVREEMKDWAGEIGRQVLTGMSRYDPERDKLGYNGSEALVCFHYNIPNNTLPLFWGTGNREGKAWKPLVDRFD